MAKRPTTRSRLTELTADLRSQNVTNKEFDKRINEIENISLLILEKIRRMDRYPVVQTKKGKLIPPKVTAPKSAALAAANDAEMSTVKDDSILMKIYTFMLKNSEKESRQHDRELSERKEKNKEKQKRYEKMATQAGLDPKTGKKRGLASKVGGFLKGSIFAGLGLGLAGLVWMFKEEVTSSAIKIKESVESLGKFLVEKFEFIKTVYNSIAKVLSPFIENVRKFGSSALDFISDKTKPVADWFQQMVTYVSSLLSDTVGQIYDTITKWTTAAVQPMIDWYQKSSKMDKVLQAGSIIAGNIDAIARFALIMSGGPVAWAAKVGTAVQIGAEGMKSAETGITKATYSEKYYKQTEDALSKFTDDDLRAIFGSDYGYMNVDREQLINDLINDPKVRRKLETPLFGATRGPKYERAKETRLRLEEREDELVRDVQSEIDRSFPNGGFTVQPDGRGGYRIFDSSGKEVASSKENWMEALRMRAKGYVTEFGSDLVQKAAERFKPQEKIDAMENTVEDLKKRFETFTGEALRQTTETASKMSESAVEAKQTAQKTVEDIKSPTDAVFSGANAAAKIVDKVNDAMKPLAEKQVTALDIWKQLETGYNQVQNAFDKVGSITSEFSSFDKASAYFKKLMPEGKDTNIQEDPRDVTSMLNNMWEQNKPTVNKSTNVMNNNSATTQLTNFTSIPVRDQTFTFKFSVAGNTVKS